MFDKIYGHESQKKTLEKWISDEKISHAYLFYGPDGIGKRQMAFEFAKKILKVDNLETCSDYKYITKMEDKKEIVVQQIRENITEDAIKRPIACDKKIYIIDEANLLNDIAQNAILKTLEEPPSYIVIILIASTTNSFLSTILSRVNKLKFNILKDDEIKEYILKNNLHLNEKIVKFSQGSIGKLDYIIKSNLETELSKIDVLLENIVKKNISNTLILSKDIDFNNNIYLEYLEFALFSHKLYESSLEIKKAISRLKMNGNYDILIDNMLLRCIESA